MRGQDHPRKFPGRGGHELGGGGALWGARPLARCSPEDVASGCHKVAGAGAGRDKRECTLQLCFSADLTQPQPRLSIIFRGKGQISAVERSRYPDDVAVLFQPKAWMDRATVRKWIDAVWAPHREGSNDAALLVTDSLDASRTTSYRRAMGEFKTICHLGPPKSTTHIWQLVDRGPGRKIKAYMQDEQDLWLLSRSNRKLFEKSTASDRRVFIAQWASDAHKRYLSEMQGAHARYAFHSGLRSCLTQRWAAEVKVDSYPKFKVEP